MDAGGCALKGAPPAERAAGATLDRSFAAIERLAERHLGAFVVASFAAILLAFTPLTLSLDDLKLPLLQALGGVALAGALVLPRRRWSRDQVAMAAWLVAALVAALAARHAWIAWPEMARRLAAFGLFLAAARSAESPGGARLLIRALLVLLGVQVGFSLFHQAGGFRWVAAAMAIDPGAERLGLAAQMILTFEGATELLGTILNVDFYSGYLATMAPLAAAGILLARSTWGRAACLALLVLCVQGLLVTLSKESLAALVAGLAVVAVGAWEVLRGAASRGESDAGDEGARPSGDVGRGDGASPASDGTRKEVGPRRGGRGLAVGVAVACVLGGALVAGPRLASVVEGLPDALGNRLVIWRGAVGMWREEPLLGVGPGGFRVAFPAHRAPDYYLHGISNVTLYAHSHYLDTLAETGALGAAAMGAFLGLWMFAGVRAARAKDAPPGARLAALGLLGAGVAMAVQDLSSPWSRWPVGMAIEAIVWGTGSGLFLGAVRGGETTTFDRAPAAPPAPAPAPGVPWRKAAFQAAVLFAFALTMHGVIQFRASVLYHRGYQAYADGDPASAVRWFEAALTADPHHASARYWLGGTRLDAGRRLGADGVPFLAAALATYEELEQRWPLYSEVAYNRSLAEDDLATHALARALAAIERGEAAAAAAAILATHRHFERAAEAARRFHAMSRRLLAARQLGDVLRREGRFLQRYEAFLPASPAPATRLEEALAVYREALARPPDADELTRAATAAATRQRMRRHVMDLLVDLGRAAEALDVARAIYDAERDQDDDALRLVELLLHDLDRPAEAAAEARRVLADVPVSPIRLMVAMQAHFVAGDDAAVRALDRRLRAVLRRIGDAALEAEFTAAAEDLRQRLDDAPANGVAATRE